MKNNKMLTSIKFLTSLFACAFSMNALAVEDASCPFTEDMVALTHSLHDSDDSNARYCASDPAAANSPLSQLSNTQTVSTLANTALGGVSQASAESEIPDVTLPNTVWQTDIESKVAQLGQGFAGDSIDESSGSLSFRHVDVSLPGNNQLPVEFARTYRVDGIDYSGNILGGWTPDVPFITLRLDGELGFIFDGGLGNDTLCLANAVIKLSGATDNDANDKVQNNLKMFIPGQGSQSLVLPTPLSVSHPYHDPTATSFNTVKTGTTTNNWKVLCEGALKNNVSGQAMTATAPNGDKYFFDVFAKRYAGFETHTTTDGGRGDGAPVLKFNHMFHYNLYASKVEDIHGNVVNYHYDTDGYLRQIESSDSRVIDIAYHDAALSDVPPVSADPFSQAWEVTYKRIKSVTANNRVWHYDYATEGEDSYHTSIQSNLRTVTLPNGKKWTFNLTLQNNRATEYYNSYRCWAADKYKENGYTGSWIKRLTQQTYVIHPEGTRVDYDFDLIKDAGGRKNTISGVLTALDEDLFVDKLDSYCESRFSDMTVSRALTKKTVTTTDNTTYVWQYQYDQSNQCRPADPTISALPTKKRTITAPDGTRIERHFYCGNAEHGQLAQEKIFDGVNLLQIGSYQYATETYINAFGPAAESFEQHRALLSNRQITRGSDVYSRALEYKVDSTASDYSYGQAVKITENNSLQTTPRVHDLAYQHDTTSWILGRLKEVKLNNTSVSRLTLDEKLRPTHHYKFGTLVGRYTYKDQVTTENTATSKPVTIGEIGALNEYFNALGHRTYFANYNRGLAQEMLRPDGEWVKREVDNNGWVTKVEDAKGQCTNYQYDSVGLLKLIDPCDTKWANTVIDYSTTQDNEGLNHVSANMFKQVVTQGNYQKVSYFDSLLRPRLVKEMDTTNESTAFYVSSTHDYADRLIFQSKPNTSSATPYGVTNSYDGLGQLVVANDNTLTGSIRYAFKGGQKIEVTDNKGNVTTTTYLAYGAPAFEKPVTIASPENVTTKIVYNDFGNITSITQSGKDENAQDISLTEYRAYDNLQQLCKVKRADVGQTVMESNALGQISWQAQGVTGGTHADCASNATNADKVSFTYDLLGNIDVVTYPGEHGFIRDFDYDKNSNVTVLTSGEVTTTYGYNSLDLLTSETLAIGSESFNFVYGHDALGNVTSLTYHDGYTVAFAPNALGQPTQAVRSKVGEDDYQYASGALYHPNGTIDSFTYGNGIVHKTELYASQLPKSITDGNVNVSALEYHYGYDANLNVTSLEDKLNPDYTLTSLTYDGLDRLTGTFTSINVARDRVSYDGLGNITAYSSDKRNFSYTYDRINNRLTDVDHVDLQTNYKSFSYDQRGNVTSNGYTTFTYNLANQMVAAGNGNTYVYDGHNRRVRKDDTSGTSYSFYSKDGTLLYRQTPDGAVNYVYLGQKLIAKDGVIPFDSGNQHHLPYGESMEGGQDGIGYTGHKYDKDLGLNYMQARYYDPVIGRFYSNDPVGTMGHLGQGNIQGFNRYNYAYNNPYKYIDPDGRQAYVSFIFTNGQRKRCEGKGAECHRKHTEEVLGGMKDGAEVLTRAGTAITAAEMISEIVKDNPVEDDIQGEVASQATEKSINPKGKKGFIEIIASLFAKIIGDKTKEKAQERQQQEEKPEDDEPREKNVK